MNVTPEFLRPDIYCGGGLVLPASAVPYHSTMARSTRLRNWTWTIFPRAGEDGPEFRASETFDKLRYCVYQHERCPNTGLEHLQGYVEFTAGLTMEQVKEWLEDNTAHIEARRGTRLQARTYCMKLDSRWIADDEPIEIGIWTGGHERERTDLSATAESIASCATWREVLRLPDQHTIARHLNWAREQYAASRPQGPPDQGVPLYPWQTALFTHLRGPPVMREVIWIWSTRSGTGKSTTFNLACREFTVLPGADYDNTLYAYDGQQIIWFDLTRSQSTERDGGNYIPYHALEKFSNHTLHLSKKYQSASKLVIAHVVVTANAPPDDSKLPPQRVMIKCLD